MHVLLVSTYELGHQPLGLATPAAALRAAGHDVRTLDTSVDRWDVDLVDDVDAVAFSVPMHTAMRLAQRAAAAVRQRRPELPLCFYGLYAIAAGTTSRDHYIAGEYEPELVAWVDGVAAAAPSARHVDVGRHPAIRPDRSSLADLERYAHLAVAGDERRVGYVEASRGCAHRCRHCPVPVVYDGRVRRVDETTVVDDVAHLVELGARHITFGDPDFLNAPPHSLRVARKVHDRFPDLTFDCTVKVEHVLHHRDVWAELGTAGCLFVVSAFECVNDAILERLDKGHTAADAAAAVDVLRANGIEPRPSWLPFTPWTTVDDVLAILDFVVDHDLIGNVDPVQYAIRLLLPPGSLLLAEPDIQAIAGDYDDERLTYPWRGLDPSADALHAELATIVEASAASGEATAATYLKVRSAVVAAAGRDPVADRDAVPVGSTEGRPRLTEPWFC